MYIKKILPAVAVALLAASMFIEISFVKASPDWIAVYPPHYEGTTIGEEFTIKINISVANLAGFEYKFRWNNTLLDVTSHVVSPPWAGFFTGKDEFSDLGDGRNQHFLAVASLPTTGWTGETTICTYTFKVIYAPEFPEPDGYSLLDLVDTKFADPSAIAIPHDEYDGEYTIKAVVPPPPKPPTVYVEPDAVTGVYGETFTVDVKIEEVVRAIDLMGWEFWLKYDTNLLDAVDVTVPNFLSDFAGPDGTYNETRYGNDTYPPYTNVTFEMMGEVSAAEVLLGNHTIPYGMGTLATITFNATYESKTYPSPTCLLELYIVKLSNSKAEPIERDVEHGEYESPYMPLGRAIDVYTEHERWPGYLTDVIGEKLNTWADSYAPQENVTVFALVTYGGDAVPNKPVIFEIQGPNNITFRRTTFTNSLGIANATFRIPWLQEYGDLVLGNWSVYASVDIAEITVSDTVYFKVGWIFDITDITLVDSTYSTAKSSIKKGEYAHFNITVRGISVVIRSAVVTVVIYDDLGVPIGFATWNGTFSGSIGDVKAGGYTEVVMNFQIYIPTGAFVGIGTAYANIYTELPSVGGAPYCPEESTTFSLEAAS